jgi:pyruvate-ferredoxin/flavodoxin oxidoreductase
MHPYDGNSAVAHVAHATNEVIAIYPITPSSNMGEIADQKSAKGEKNIWGTVPNVVELQSEGGAAGAIHGALSAGSLATTFTASQGLLLMIPNMYKIAGELTPTVFHVAARALSCQALCIFGDHSDVMATRQTGWALLASSSVQEAMDMALIAQAATLESRIPFLHFFDGFRTSHEIQKIEELTFDDMRAMIDDELINAHRARALSPDHPTIKGTSQNPDVCFTGRETVNKFYPPCRNITQKAMDKFAKLTGRQYHLFDYFGAQEAEKIIVAMGSGAEVIHETVDYLVKKGEKVGVVNVRLYRPFDVEAFAKVLPKTVKSIAVLDRTKEPGSLGEPLYEDVRTAVGDALHQKLVAFKEYPVIVGGRYGLGSADFTPAMVKAVFDNLTAKQPKNSFTVGVVDDVMKTSLVVDYNFSLDDTANYQALFYGLGSDGTVGANKNTIKIISELTNNYTQGYFVYDSKKAGTITVSHLRFGPKPISSSYLVTTADFIACHNFTFLEKYDMLSHLKKGGVFLLTAEYDKDTVWAKIPGRVQKQIIDQKVKFYVIDAVKIAERIGLGPRINTVMQTAFFEISKVIDPQTAIQAVKDAIKKTYGGKGEKVVNMNIAAVDQALTGIQEVIIPKSVSNPIEPIKPVTDDAPEFVKEVTALMLKAEGEKVKVSQMPDDGTWPTATTQYEKRNIAVNIPEWEPKTCIQCGRCSLLCPHAAIRPKIYQAELLKNAPATFKSTNPIATKGAEGMKYTLQIAPEDCTGCANCVEYCPVKDKGALKMIPQTLVRKQEAENYKFFLDLPETPSSLYQLNSVKGSQFVRPLFEYSGACLGCGETPYIKLLTQLFGDRLLIGNATGCTSIYGGNLPTTPYAKRQDGRGPAWSNSLFEDNAEFAYGMRLSVDKFNVFALELLNRVAQDSCCAGKIGPLAQEIKSAKQSNSDEIEKQRERVERLKAVLKDCDSSDCRQLVAVADYLVQKSVWALGGDGWAYDIGFGGLDHVLASGRNVNLLVLDTEVYSNTGGQASKSTPLGAVAPFAASGKPIGKKDLGLMMMSYGYVYVAKVAMGYDQNQVIKAFTEAEAYNGPSIIIAYAHCINHGINMSQGFGEQKKAVESGAFITFRYNPMLAAEGKNPFQLDTKELKIPFSEYAINQNRFRVLKQRDPAHSEQLIAAAQKDIDARMNFYKQLAAMPTVVY